MDSENESHEVKSTFSHNMWEAVNASPPAKLDTAQQISSIHYYTNEGGRKMTYDSQLMTHGELCSLIFLHCNLSPEKTSSYAPSVKGAE